MLNVNTEQADKIYSISCELYFLGVIRKLCENYVFESADILCYGLDKDRREDMRLFLTSLEEERLSHLYSVAIANDCFIRSDG